jgi:hypothetical protein
MKATGPGAPPTLLLLSPSAHSVAKLGRATRSVSDLSELLDLGIDSSTVISRAMAHLRAQKRKMRSLP